MRQPERPMRAMDRNINGAVIVINNHIADGQREDTAGPVAVRVLGESRVFVDRDSRQFLYYCREDLPAVSAAIEKAGSEGARFILTVGGTGISTGDIAPEATAPFLDVQMDGIAQQIRQHGLVQTPLASLSRGLVGITHRERVASSSSMRPDLAAASRIHSQSSVRYSPTSSSSWRITASSLPS